MLQAAILASAGLISRFFGFLYRPPMTNLIGDEGIAIYSAGYYIYTFLLILSSAGLPAGHWQNGIGAYGFKAVPKCP